MTADIPCDGQRRATRELRRLEVVAVTGDCEDLGEVEYRKSNIIRYSYEYWYSYEYHHTHA